MRFMYNNCSSLLILVLLVVSCTSMGVVAVEFPMVVLGGRYRVGRGCDANNAFTHPGFLRDHFVGVDSNCNGIVGVNMESLYCEGTSARYTLTIFGDSISTGYSLSRQEVPTLLSWLSFDFSKDRTNPQLTYGTAYGRTFEKRQEGPGSLYLKLRKWNRCNHGDFQNVAQNGNKMADLVVQVENMKIHTGIHAPSKPTLGIVAMVGNDICNAKTLDEMTTEEAYERQLTDGLKALNARVTRGSKILISGVVDGRSWFEQLESLPHPVYGIKYSDWWSSMGTYNPCPLWLKSDPSTRIQASDRAAKLSAIAKRVVDQEIQCATHPPCKTAYPNLELAFIDFNYVLRTVITKMKALQGSSFDIRTIFNEIDGFHPSLQVHSLVSDVLWEYLMATTGNNEYQFTRSWFGSENHRNWSKLDKLQTHDSWQ